MPWSKKNPESAQKVRDKSKVQYLNKKKTHPEWILYHRSKASAKRRNIQFDLEISDIVIPDICPILNIPIEWDYGSRNTSPSVDRINNKYGYVKSNVQIISNRANTVKSNMSIADVERLLAYMRSHEENDAKL